MWAVTYPKGCRNNNPVSYSASIINVTTDIMIFVLPLPSLLSLHLDRKDKGMFLEESPTGFVPGRSGGVWWITDPFPNSFPDACVLDW